MAFVPKTPKPRSGGSSISKRLEQMKKEMEAKRGGGAAVAEAAAGESAGPEAGQAYTLREGDTLESIAGQVDQEPDAIWNHDDNQKLREQRDTPGKLQAGDSVFIPEKETGTGPVGQGEWVVKDGDCISSIAKDTGHFWETIWNHPDNAELKEVRKDPNVLLRKDLVTIPETTSKEEPGETEMRHRFIRRGEPSMLRLVIKRDGSPVGNAPFRVELEERIVEGTTSPVGRLEVPVRGNDHRALVIVDDDPRPQLVYDLELGGTEPVETYRGVQQRLKNLGFGCTEVTGQPTPESREALKTFQHKHELAVTGDADPTTRQKLKEVHQS